MSGWGRAGLGLPSAGFGQFALQDGHRDAQEHRVAEQPEDGFTIYVHPYFLAQPEWIPYLVLYQLVLVNYGEFATAEDAEVFGASALGLSQEEYYSTLCQLADELSPEGNPPV